MLPPEIKESFLSIIRLGIGHSAFFQPKEVDWSALEKLASKQGLSAILVDGIDKVPEGLKPPKPLLLQWIGEVIQNYELRYELYKKTIAEMSALYAEKGYKMMVLKGYACSLDWPKPEHRPCGDIDIWMFGEQKCTDALLVDKKNIDVDYSHHHHTVFYWGDFMVENHYDFLNVHHHKSNVELEGILKKLGNDSSHYSMLKGEWVYLPSANLHALFLLRHSMSNFASTGMRLRQLLDWAFFVEKHGKEVDWKWLLELLNKFGMRPLFEVFNAICVEDLGFELSNFSYMLKDPLIKERVLNDILSREFSEEEKGGILKRAIFKYRRWRANAWKHELCFKESMWSAFWSGVKSHLLKPSSI